MTTTLWIVAFATLIAAYYWLQKKPKNTLDNYRNYYRCDIVMHGNKVTIQTYSRAESPAASMHVTCGRSSSVMITELSVNTRAILQIDAFEYMLLELAQYFKDMRGPADYKFFVVTQGVVDEDLCLNLGFQYITNTNRLRLSMR